MTNINEFAVEVFKAVDAMDPERFSQFLTPDAVFVFGNGDPVKGREAIVACVKEVFTSFNGIHHEMLDVWNEGEALIIRQLVTYTRKDGKIVQLPCANILLVKDGLISDFRIYMDIGPVYA